MSTEEAQHLVTTTEEQNQANHAQQNSASIQSSNATQFGQPNAQGVVFYQIIDLITEVQRSNFLPALHALRFEFIPRDYLDHSGYHLIHYAVSQNAIPILLILLDHFKLDVNIKSRNNQTPLMIACNYGSIEIIRILLERGATVSDQDDTRFSPLLYSVKQGHIPQVCYLLHHSSDINVVDANGCTIVHWAAYTNKVFLLKIFKRLGLNMQGTDATGLTPLERAIQGESYQAVDYLINHVHTGLPANLKVDEIKIPDIKEIVRKKFFPTEMENLKKSAVNWFRARSRVLTFATYVILWLLSVHLYREAVMYKGFGYAADLIFFIAGLYFVGFSYFYYLKSYGGPSKKFKYDSLHISQGDGEESLNSTMAGTPRVMDSIQKYNFDSLDKLIHGQHAGTVIHDGKEEVQGFDSFLHEMAWLFEVKNYKEIAKFDERDFCAECLTRRNPRSAHPEHSRTCVDNFHHYSYFLGRSVDSSNHVLYLLLLISQSIIFTLFLFGMWVSYWPQIKNGKLAILEAGYLVQVEYGFFHGLLYWLLLGLSIYNLAFLLIEVYGVCKNLTYHEIFNTPSCTYLHKTRQDRRGAIVKGFGNPFDKGIVQNVFSYFQRILN